MHPKDPFKRVDLVASSRPIRVLLEGQTLAETSWSIHLYETLLPRRYYIPLTSIKQSLLRRSETKTKCPYKGEAEYWDIVLPSRDGKEGKVYKDLVWTYVRPTLECGTIAGLACFYNEKVDIEVDGEAEQRPKTFFG